MRENCYLCGAADNLTRDHIPPLGFFPKPRPSNLITVPCCHSCNKEWSQEDEYMRALLSLSDIGRSTAGDAVFRDRVVPRIEKSSPKLRDWLLSGMEDIELETPTGTIKLTRWTFSEADMKRVQKFMARLTKGFLRYLFPELDISKVECFARHIHNQSILAELKPITDRLRYDERGDGVIRFG